MAIPTITTVNPLTGPASGDNFVTITGTNFQVQGAVPVTGERSGSPAGFESPPQTVRVLVDGVTSSQVFVESTTELKFRPPVYTGDPTQTSYPAVSIVIENIDEDGVLIPTETVTLTGGYTYSRDALRPPTLTLESPYARIVRVIIENLMRETIFETGISTHTDYSSDGIISDFAKLPSLYLTGPSVERDLDAMGEDNVPVFEKQIDDSYFRYPPPTYHIFTFGLIGISDSQIELLTLMGSTRKFFRRHPYLVMTADVPANSQLRMPMIMVDDPDATSDLSNANLRTFTCTFELRRVPILSLPPDLQTYDLEELELELEKMGSALLETVTIFNP